MIPHYDCHLSPGLSTRNETFRTFRLATCQENAELDAIGICLEVLNGLPGAGAARVLDYLYSRVQDPALPPGNGAPIPTAVSP